MVEAVRHIAVDARTADLLEAQAAARGISVGELVADLARAEAPLPPDLAELRARSDGPWSPDVLAEDARRLKEFERTRVGVPWDEVEAWMRSWGRPEEKLPPVPRKL